MIKVCLDYNIETSEIIKAITLVEIKPELLSLLSQVHIIKIMVMSVVSYVRTHI